MTIELKLGIPRGPLQERAFLLMYALAEGPMRRERLYELMIDASITQKKAALRYLRLERYIYVSRYDDDGEMVFKIGVEPDAKRPKRMKEGFVHRTTTKTIKIPPADPLLAALFGR